MKSENEQTAPSKPVMVVPSRVISEYLSRKLPRSRNALLWFAMLLLLLACRTTEESKKAENADSVASAINPLEECSSRLPLAYGGSASSNCFLKCFSETQNKGGCHSVCDHLVAELYPRTLLPVRKTEEELVMEMNAQCESLNMNEIEPLPVDSWLRQQESVIKALATTPRDLEVYNAEEIVRQFLAAESAALGLPPVAEAVPEYQKFYIQLRKELCLRQLLAVTQLAVLQAATRDDLYSEKYYRTIETLLLSESVETGDQLPRLFGEAVQHSVAQLVDL